MEDIFDLFYIDEHKRERIRVTKKEARNKVIEISNELSEISKKIREYEKNYCNEDFDKFYLSKKSEFDFIDYEEKYLKQYEDFLKKENKLMKELAFYRKKC